MACGNYHTGVLLRDGTVRTFGSGGSGRLGVNDTTNRSTAVQVFGISSSASALGCGQYHTAVLLADGSVRTFGQNTSGALGTGDSASRLTPVQVASVMKNLQGSVAQGKYHTAVVMSDGTVRTFGRNAEGQLGVNDTTSRQTPVQVSGLTSATAVACGNLFTAVLLADGTVRTFGDNQFGQLGVNNTINRLTPVQVLNISTATSVACGGYYVAVLLADRTVRTFGFNNIGQLGVDDTTSRQTPVQVLNITSATAVGCGGQHTAVVLADGTVRTFGNNGNGQLGINSVTTQPQPFQVWGISSSAVAVAGGGGHTIVLLADGTVRTFGNNLYGNLGVNDTTQRNTPVTVLNITSATAIAGGRYLTAVLLADGTVRTFGYNGLGGLGVNDTTQRNTPVPVFGISSYVTAIAGGWYHTAVLLADGSVRTFGRNNVGQLGLGDTVSRLTPVESITLPARTLAGSVAGGGNHTAVVLRDGTVRTFGNNGNGQLGVGDTTSRLMPVQVIGLSTATAVAGGDSHTAVILADGTVRTFGKNANGQLGVNDTTSRLTPVQVLNITSATAISSSGTSNHTVVLLADGTVRTFGQNNYGQLGVNDATNRLTPVQVFGISSSATAVAGGYFHTAILLADGTVRTFGRNDNGQLGVNDTTSRLTPVQVWGISSSATAVACGYYHAAVLLADGTVRTFGRNNIGQLGVNDNTTRSTPVTVLNVSTATAVACGGYNTAVLLADGTVRTFGANANGELGVNDTTDRSTPVQVFGISSSATVLACGGNHTAVILANGTVQTFGSGGSGKLGLNDTTSRLTPVQVVAISATVSLTPAPTAFLTSAATSITLAASAGQIWTSSATGPARTTSVSIAAGSYFTGVILKDGTVRTFGRNNFGALGTGDTTNRLTPVTVLNITSATGLSMYVSALSTIVLLSDGTVRTFGQNNAGQLGLGDTTSRLTPVTVLNITSATAVAGGGYHTAVLLTDGTVRTFGSNGNGQLGINDTTSRLTPVTVLNITSATAIAGGAIHTAVLLADGTVRTFGSNGTGQLGVNDTTDRYTPVQVFGISSSATAVACGSNFTVVLLANGTVRTFGLNTSGQLGVGDATQRNTPVGVLNITSASAIACGTRHTIVLLADGTVRTFGHNTEGQLGVNDTTSRLTPVQVFGISSSATAISGNYGHSAVLLADGTVRTFGSNAVGNLGTNDTTNRSTPVPVFGALGGSPYPTYVTAKGLALGLSAPTFQLDLSTDKARKLSTTTWTTGSDSRIKSDIQSANLARCVDIVDSLDLKYFKWDIPGVAGPTDSHSLGWIAQDVKEFFPNSVRQTQDYGFDDFHNLDSDQLIKTMYGALKKMCQDTYGQ